MFHARGHRCRVDLDVLGVTPTIVEVLEWLHDDGTLVHFLKFLCLLWAMRTFGHDRNVCKLPASGSRFAASVAMMIRDKIGEVIGGLWAPFIHALAELRHARMFHPEGQLFSGTLAPIPGSPYEPIARQLGRTVLARCSGALRRGGRESLDVLGIALRMHHGQTLGVHAAPSDQDLLFATIRSPFTMPLSPLTTRSHDFFANRYYAVAPFQLEGLHRVELRLDPIDRSPRSGSRADKLAASVAADKAHFELSARRTLTRTWHPLALVSLTAPSDLDQTALRFDPYQCGAGIVPVGLVNAIRKRAYAASQSARPDQMLAARTSRALWHEECSASTHVG